MTTPKFLQIHTLHSYPAALLNRDDSGLAKRLPFGAAVRTRISSQCLKRHWRGKTHHMDEGIGYQDREYALHKINGAVLAERTRNVVGRRVIQPIKDAGVVGEDVLTSVETEFVKGLYGPKAKPGDDRAAQATRQPLLFGLPEIEFLLQQARSICEENPQDKTAAGDAVKKFFGNNTNNFRVMREQLSVDIPKGKHAGLEGALFGRMVTSDPGANIDAAIHVAHAFTVHREESESDYFSVVDDLQRDDEDAGAAHIGDMELTAGLFYGYVVMDVPALVSNLEGCKAGDWQSADRELAAKVVEHLLHLIATVTPGAKLGSTAPYACADLVLVEAGSRQPRSLANAYRDPARPQVEEALKKLSGYLEKLDGAYGGKEVRRFMSVEDCAIPGAETVVPGRPGNLDGGSGTHQQSRIDYATSDNAPGIAADVLWRRNNR